MWRGPGGDAVNGLLCLAHSGHPASVRSTGGTAPGGKRADFGVRRPVTEEKFPSSFVPQSGLLRNGVVNSSLTGLLREKKKRR